MNKIINLFLLLTLVLISCKSADSKIHKANEYISKGDFNNALHYLNEAILIDEKNIDAYLDRGFVKANLQDYLGAIEDYSKVIKLDSVNILAYCNISKNFNKVGNQKLALDNINIAWMISTQHKLYNLSLIDMRSPYSIDPIDILYDRGVIYYDMDSVYQAISDLNICIENGMNDAYYLRGLCYIKGGNNKQGCEDLHKALNYGITDASNVIIEHCLEDSIH